METLPNWIGGLPVPCSKQEKLRLGVVGLWVPNLHHFEMSVHPASLVKNLTGSFKIFKDPRGSSKILKN